MLIAVELFCLCSSVEGTSSGKKGKTLQAFLETCGFAIEKVWGIHTG